MSKILVEFEATVKDEVGAVNALKQRLKKRLKKYDRSGKICPISDDELKDSFIDLLKICLSGPDSKEILMHKGNYYVFSSAIEVIGSFSINMIYEAYFEILPYLEPGSKLNITVVNPSRHLF